MTLRLLFCLLCLGGTGWAQAEIYKSTDAEGHVTYSSTPSRGAIKLGLESAPRTHASAKDALTPTTHARDHSSPSDFPKVDKNTQRNRDSTRRKILSDELEAEEKLLAEARMSLSQTEVSNRGEQTGGKLRAQREEVTLHEKNISALKTELNNIR